MKFFSLVALSVPALVAAQGYGPAPGPSATTPAVPSASAGQHIVQVAAGSTLTFTPNVVTAAVNETVTFIFSPMFNHSVSQSTFANPCTLAPNGFDSGIQPPGSTWSLVIENATQPIWFFCQQTTPLDHCGMGMVGAINPPTSGNTFAAFSSAAISIGSNEGPQTANIALSGIGAFATAAPSIAPPSSAERLVVGVGLLLSGVVGAIYTLA